jgi:hypothetical protein
MGLTGIAKSQVSRPCGEIDGKVRTFLTWPLEPERPRGPSVATDSIGNPVSKRRGGT